MRKLLKVLARLFLPKLTDVLSFVFWVSLLSAVFAAGQEEIVTDPPYEEEGLPHGDSGRFLAEQAVCLAGLDPGSSQRKRFESCAQSIIEKYSHVRLSYEEYVGVDAVTLPPRVYWPPLFPMKE